MRCFKDNNGRQWTLSVTVGALKRVRTLAGIDLYKLVEVDDKGNLDTSVLKTLATDPIALVDSLYAVCKPEADKAGITDEQFGESMAGDAIEQATDALVEEILDFFPGARKRALKEIWMAAKEYEAKAETELNNVLADGFREKVLSAMENANGLSGKSQGKSALTQAK